MFTSTTKYTWQEVANSDELGQFLSEAGINSTKQRSKLERLLHRDGFDTLGDLHDMMLTTVAFARGATSHLTKSPLQARRLGALSSTIPRGHSQAPRAA